MTDFNKKKNLIHFFLIFFLALFMLLIFGPAEIYYANKEEFKFIYRDFGMVLALFAVSLSLIGTMILALIPQKLSNGLTAVVFGMSLAGYLQVMFLNKNLDLLGERPDGYQAGKGQTIVNTIIWVAVIIACVVLVYFREEIMKKIMVYGAAFLLCIQFIAYISLLVPMSEKNDEEMWSLSGEDQLTLSTNQNIVVFILDYFSQKGLEDMKAVYPEAMEWFSDFTSYSNEDCVFMGTYPSIIHMLSGCDYDPSVRVNDWTKECWENDNTVNFYTQMHDLNYKTNLYTPDTRMVCGGNNPSILKNVFSNVTAEAENREINHKRLYATMTKMCCYRMAPEILKPFFYAEASVYNDIVTEQNYPILHKNYVFHQKLMDNGITLDDSTNYLQIYHLEGVHEYDTDAEGIWDTSNTSPPEDTARGSLVIVKKYMDEMRELGVYDDSVIIITADHGDFYEPSVIFFVKTPGEMHDEIQINDAPTMHCDILPTIADCAGLSYDNLGSGRTIWDVDTNEVRERYFMTRYKSKAHPMVPLYTGDRMAKTNTVQKYYYHGELEVDEENPDEIIPMIDSFFY